MLTKERVADYLAAADIQINGGRPWDIEVHDDKFFKTIMMNPSLRVGEAYMTGKWDCPRLDELFFRLCRLGLESRIDANVIGRFTSFLSKKLFNWHTRIQSLKVAKVHYNLGNDLYSRMLGETMAYTCAYWRNANNLDKAQNDKFDLVCRKVGLKAGDRVLELGCGWGNLAHYMATRYGCEVTAVNISHEQIKFARENHRDPRVHFFKCDYRDEAFYNPDQRPFDKVVSVGLCEHVGHSNYRTFLELARRNLKEEGLFLLHTIGKNESSSYTDPWISTYIFPNGMLPSIQLLSRSMEGLFVLEDLHNFGADYDKTLMAWQDNFEKSWPQFKDAYGPEFYRMWNYYLLSCAGAFRARAMQLWQFVLSPHGVLGGYSSVR